MKIKKIEIKNNKILKDISVDFEKNGKIIDTIVVAGSNGSGKTTFLESIWNYFLEISEYRRDILEKVDITFNDDFEKLKELDIIRHLKYANYDEKNDIKTYKETVSLFKVLPKLIYIPTEINFSEVKTETTNFYREYSFFNMVDFNMIKDIPSYIVSKVMYILGQNENLTMLEARKKVTEEINGIFNILELDVKLKGISKDGKNMPIFENSQGEEFDINELSSGEKQLFLRTLSIKMLEPEDSIILIDEPELSLHPKWQQQIIKVYQNIGKNNQIILATHSPHILGSVPSENIIILSKNEENKIVPITGEELYSSYGQTSDRILEDIMGMKSARNIEVQNLLDDVRNLVSENRYETDEFKEKYNELENILGNSDSDLMLIDMEIKRRKRG
ncbi:MAG: AAA family ATPase [Fusobacterium sp.]|uniref:AAA family ATPase n=1 Tax=Fusobacterium sp. TaxID=68766 RepID=UPI002A7660E4|nr:AAA family ATPase [Fusobacterium sp.]MDY2981721.1 AAA family ATPase [Fusobacterium sp.]